MNEADIFIVEKDNPNYYKLGKVSLKKAAAKKKKPVSKKTKTGKDTRELTFENRVAAKRKIQQNRLYTDDFEMAAPPSDFEDESDQEELLKDPRNVPVWFGTNRKPINIDSSAGFGDEWTDKTTLGRCIVNVPEGHVPGSTGSSWWVRLIKGDDRLKLVSIDEIPENTYWDSLSTAMKEVDNEYRKGEALFFLHGYNVTFEQAAYPICATVL